MDYVKSNTLKVTWESQCTSTDTFTKIPAPSFYSLTEFHYDAGYSGISTSINGGWGPITINSLGLTKSNANCWYTTCSIVKFANDDPPNGN
jgi:hypothetical protein